MRGIRTVAITAAGAAALALGTAGASGAAAQDTRDVRAEGTSGLLGTLLPGLASGATKPADPVTGLVLGLLPGVAEETVGAVTGALPAGGATDVPAETTPPSGTTPTVAPPAPPVLGRSVGVTPTSGRVLVELPGTRRPVAIAEPGSIPAGTVIDARDGTLVLRTALGGARRTQTIELSGARFEVRQAPSGRGMTDLILREPRPSACPGRGARARAAAVRASTRRSRGLWAKDRNGRFRTRGRNSVATVRGTRWLTRETCAGTLTRVVEGAVAVRELRTGRTVLVRAGQSHVVHRAR